MVPFSWLITFLLIDCAIVDGTNNSATPLGKVVELLDVLKEHLNEDTLHDGNNYASYAEATVKEIASGKSLIKETKQKVSTLQTDLDEENASREQMVRDSEQAANELTKAERELSDAKTQRDQEHKVFLKNEAVFEESIDQLSRSVDVLAKRFKDQPQDGASLLSMATSLQNTLESGTDFSLTRSQREMLHQFSRLVEQKVSLSHPSSFLQLKSTNKVEPDADYGEYESQSSPVVTTLQNVLKKTETNKETSMKEEEISVADFKKVQEQLQGQINTAKTRMEGLKSQIAESEQRSSELTADLLAGRELLQATTKHVELLEQDFRSKTSAFKQRALKRSDELTAVGEAISVLTSETAKRFATQQSIGSAEAPAFFQTSKVIRQKTHVVQTVKNSGLVLLALQIQSQAGAKADPFGKVKSMVKQMLDKLLAEANKDADHHAFCESEMSKSTESLDAKSADIQKLSDQLMFLGAEIERLTDELVEAKRNLADMNQALTAAAQVREKEKLRATQSLKDYQSAQKLLKHAVDVLKKFYSKEAVQAGTADTTGAEEVHGEGNREGLGSGVVAILEIAVQDFKELEEDTRLEEVKAEQMFKDLTLETRIRTAQFQKNVEYKTREHLKNEGEQARAQADLKSYQKELSAVSQYFDQLKAQCIAKADPYEVRKARREKELQGLKEALQFLFGDGAF